MSDDEAFPHSEQLFRDAFSPSDPMPELLKLIWEHPVYPAVADMLHIYTWVTEENPYRRSRERIGVCVGSSLRLSKHSRDWRFQPRGDNMSQAG
jgi:hypothetical protein